MKTKLIILITLLCPAAFAQVGRDTYIDRDLVALQASAVFVGLILVFLIEVLRRYLDYRLKEKILESGVTEELASLLLNSGRTDQKRSAMRWLLLFLGLALGFIIITFFALSLTPALAVLALGLTGSFAAYYSFLKRTDH